MSTFRMTFSLASLILLFAFIAMPAMAQTPAPVSVSISGGDLPAGAYLIVGNAANATAAGLPSSLPNGSIYVQASSLPNLEELFKGVGGTILLNASRTGYDERDPPEPATANFRFDSNGADEGGLRDLQVGDLYITEIMWGINKQQAGTSAAEDHQWIEIWNKTGQSIPSAAIGGLSLDFSYDRPAAALIDKAAVDQDTTVTPNVDAAPGEVTLDRVSNVVGAGWTNDLGQSGDTTTNALVPFISMYRDEKADRGRQIANGSAKGSWKQSTESYLANHVGTPGAVERAGARTFSASGVALTVVFNEIANFPSGSTSHEWIELRVRSGDPHFENWRRLSR